MNDLKPTPVPGRLLVKDLRDDEFQTDSGLLLMDSGEEGELRRAEVVDPGTTSVTPGDQVLVRPTAGVRYNWKGGDGLTRALWVIAESEIYVVFRGPE